MSGLLSLSLDPIICQRPPSGSRHPIKRPIHPGPTPYLLRVDNGEMGGLPVPDIPAPNEVSLGVGEVSRGGTYLE